MKKTGKIILGIGIIIIIVGFFLFLTKDKKNIEKKEEPKIKYEVTFSELVGEEISANNYDFYTISTLKESYINDFDIKIKNKFNFGYPDNLVYIGGDFFGKEFGSTNFNIYAGYFNDFFSLEKLLKNVTDKYEKDGYTKINYILGNDLNIDGYKVGYVKFTAAELDTTTSNEENYKKYKEEFYVYIESNNNVITIRYELKNLKFDTDTLNKIINSISIEENAASYLVSKVQNGKISGKLTMLDSNDNVSNLYYEFSTERCFEIDSISNGYSSVDFSTSDKKMTFNIKMQNVIYDHKKYNNLYSYYKEYLKNLYTNDKNIEDYKMTDYTVNKKKYLKMSYSKNDEGKKKENVSYIEFVDDEVLALYSFESENKILDSETKYFLDCNIIKSK